MTSRLTCLEDISGGSVDLVIRDPSDRFRAFFPPASARRAEAGFVATFTLQASPSREKTTIMEVWKIWSLLYDPSLRVPTEGSALFHPDQVKTTRHLT